MANADHRSNNDARLRRDVLCFGDVAVTDLRAGTIARRRAWLRLPRCGACDRIGVDCFGNGAAGNFSEAGTVGGLLSRSFWSRHGSFWSFKSLLVFAADACRHRSIRHGQHSAAPNDSTTRYAESFARAHDVNQHDVLHGWPTAR